MGAMCAILLKKSEKQALESQTIDKKKKTAKKFKKTLDKAN